MPRIFIMALLIFALHGCGTKPVSEEPEEPNEVAVLRRVVADVGRDLEKLGFVVDCSQINIVVKDPDEMTALFNDISAEARQEIKSHASSGPAVNKTQDADAARLAFYDPNSKSIVFRRGAVNSLTKGYLAHELAHAYQDQKWGFDEIWNDYQDKPSRELFNITQFIIEGHAELVRHAYEQNQSNNPQDMKALSLSLGTISENDCLPCHTQQSLATLPYVFGMRFMVNQYRTGGWPRVEKFFEDLPASTEQIIHENKYQSDEPSELTLPIWDGLTADIEPILNGSLGEAYLLAKLLAMPIDSEDAFFAASGWDGDVAQIYHLPNGKEVMAWRIVLDRPLDAQQLEAAIKRVGSEGDAFRMGRVVDWIITKHPDLRKAMRIFLSKHPIRPAVDFYDEQSTLNQEDSIRSDAKIFSESYFIPKIVIGPNL